MDDSTLGSGLGYFICVPEIETSWKQAPGAEHHPFCRVFQNQLQKWPIRLMTCRFTPFFAHFSRMEKMNQGPQSHGCRSKRGFQNKTQQEREKKTREKLQESKSVMFPWKGQRV